MAQQIELPQRLSEPTPAELAKAERMLLDFLGKLLDPGRKMPADQWAESFLELDPAVTRFPGPLRLDRTPYLRGPLRAFTEPQYRRHVYVFGTQIGKTLIIQILLAYTIDTDPGPTMIVFPDRNFAKRRSRKHLRPLIERSPVLLKHLTGKQDDLQLFEYALNRMTINIAWAGSPSMMASEAIRYLYRDEFPKYRQIDKDEAHPMELSARRVSSWGHLAKIVDAGTPALINEVGDRDLRDGTWHECWVPCKHCGKPDMVADVPDPVIDPRNHVENGKALGSQSALDALRARLKGAGYQVLEWDNITWDKTIKDRDQAALTAHYECPYCKGQMHHSDVRSVTSRCKWVPRHPERTEATWQLPCWYRDDERNSFAAVAGRWLRAQGDPRKIQDCLNGDRAIGYEEIGSGRSEDEIRKLCCRDYPVNVIPFVPLFVFITVDLRAPEIHFVVRAWGYHESSGQVRYGMLPRLRDVRPGEVATGETLEVLDRVRELTFRCTADGHDYPANLMGIDSGWRTDEVYAYCRTRPRCVAMKGEDMKQVWSFSKPEKDPLSGQPRYDSCQLVAWQKEYFADVLEGKMGIGQGLPGEWMLSKDIGDDLLQHLTAEKKIEKPGRWGRIDKRWRQTRKGNHWLDCERMQVVLARYAGVADVKPPTPKKTTRRDDGDSFLGRDVSSFTQRFGR